MDNINKENELIEVKENEIVTAESITTKIKVIINHVQKTAIEGAIEIGIELKKLKELVAHGEWEKYIADNLDFSSRKAREFMQLADKYSDKDSEYFIAISKRRIYADLSVSNALALLTVPENEVKKFTENVKVENLKVDELKNEIKKLKEEIKTGEAEQKNRIEALNQEKKENEKLLQKIESEKNMLEEKLKQKEENLQSELKEKQDSNNNEDLEKKKEEINQLREEMKLLKESIEESHQKNEELKKEILKKENQIEEVKKNAAEEVAKSKKKAEIGSNESAVKIKIQINILQEAFNKAEEEIKKMEESDREKFKGAVQNLLEKLHNRL